MILSRLTSGIVVSMLALGVIPAVGAEMLARPVAARVVRVIDGDTLEVRAQVWLGQEITASVRLVGIDTPELKGACPAERTAAEAARARLEKLTEGGVVMLRQIQSDKFGGRVLAQVSTNGGVDLAQSLIAAKLSRVYQGGKRAGWCGETARPPTQ